MSRSLAAGGELDEPMHRWYDTRHGMFDVLDLEYARRRYAPNVVDGEVLGLQEAEECGAVAHEGVDLRSASELLAAGLDVRIDQDAVDGDHPDVVNRDVFHNWLLKKDWDMAGELLSWWTNLQVASEGEVDGWKLRDTDSVPDVFARLCEDLRKREWLEDGDVTVLALARWCRTVVGDICGGGDFAHAEDVASYMRPGFRIAQ